MLPLNLLNALKEYTLAQKPPLPTGAADTPAKTAPQLEVGQKVQGTVQTQVAANVYKVSVAGQTLQLQLPASLKNGDTVTLQIVSLLPRLVLSMAGATAPVATPGQLGSTAKILSAMSQQPQDKAYVRAPQTKPLWETAQPPEAKQLAVALRDALGKSGLFYESHQAQWLNGQRTTTQLLQEPQNLSPEEAKAAVANPQDIENSHILAENNVLLAAVSDKLPTPAQANPAQQPLPPEIAAKPGIPANPQAAPEIATPNSPPTAPTAANTSPASAYTTVANTSPAVQSNVGASSTSSNNPAPGIPNHLQPLVQQQLNALETSQMIWQGAVWPGQEMQWEIHEQASRARAETNERQWVTQIRLDLPNMGEVAATLRFNSAGLGLTLNAANPQTRAAMGAASTQLVAALASAGIPVVSTQVQNTP
jgi:Flagellar hook-length control protein FliK